MKINEIDYLNRFEAVNMYRLHSYLQGKGDVGAEIWEVIINSHHVRNDLRYLLPFIDAKIDDGNFFWNDEKNISHVEVVDVLGLREEIHGKINRIEGKDISLMRIIEECRCILADLRIYLTGKALKNTQFSIS